MDCDAFYASVEKRDNPALRDQPVIVGGGQRGVVSTCCYIARIHGVRSAMPMFQALKLCPQAVVVPPRMSAYVDASRAIRAMMERLTPAIEPLSLDEAFLDLSGTARLHGAPPAVMLAGLVRRMENELGLTGSIGLSHNKFLAKIASDLDKPKGFSVIGLDERLREDMRLARYRDAIVQTTFIPRSTLDGFIRLSEQSREVSLVNVGPEAFLAAVKPTDAALKRSPSGGMT